MILFSFDFGNILTILLFLFILCLLIALHELGHLLTAKKFNVYCYEYSIGFGKAFYKNTKHETHFCLRVLPLGGFVKMAGEEGVTEDEELLDNNNQPIPKDRILANIKQGPKILVMAAGGLVNMLVAFICFYIIICIQGMPQYNSNIFAIDNSGIIASQGIVNGSTIHNVEISLFETNNGEEVIIKTPENFKISKWEDINEAFTYGMPTAANQTQKVEIIYSLENSDELFTTTFTRISIENNGSFGFAEKLGISMAYKDCNILSAIPNTFAYMWYYLVETLKAFGQLFTGNLNNLSGLVGIYQAVDQSARLGLLSVISITGAISFSLGFFNLIPFPALDGGRIFFRLIEIITRKKINPKIEGNIHALGLFLLFGLMIIVNIKDIIGLF